MRHVVFRVFALLVLAAGIGSCTSTSPTCLDGSRPPCTAGASLTVPVASDPSALHYVGTIVQTPPLPALPLDLTLFFGAPHAVAASVRPSGATFDVTGSYAAGTGTGGFSGTVRGTLTDYVIAGGTFAGVLTATTSSGCVAQRNYTGPLTSEALNWTAGAPIETCGGSSPLTFPMTLTSAPPSASALSVSPASQPVSASGQSGLTASVSSNVGWTAVSDQSWIAITAGTNGTGNGTITYRVESTSTARTGHIAVSGGGASASLTIDQAGASTPSPTIVTQPLSQTIASGATATLSVTASGTTLSYQWYVGSSGTTTTPVSGATSSSFTTPALTSTTSYWVRVSNSGGSVDSGTATVTVTAAPVAPAITTQPQSQTIASGATATLSVIATGTAPLGYQWFAGPSGTTTAPIAGATGSSFATPALTNTTSYWVRVSNSAGTVDSSTATITVTAAPLAPTITTQPQNQTIASGATATMSVTANGTAPLSYQWFVGTSGTTTTPVSGATASSYTTPALTSTTSYWVRVSNSAGTVNSSTATVTVTAAPVAPAITTQPQSQTIASGATATMSVIATGTAPLSYQWFIGTSGTTTAPIAGATASSYTTPALASTTSYWVRVSNSAGAVDSSTATVTVTPAPSAPTITTQPQGQTIASGATATMSVIATGTAPLSYQWFIGTSGTTTAPIAGATASSYTTPALASTTSYWVRVSNSAGAVDSSTATVTVTPATVPPTITTQPQGQTIASGATATMSVIATGTAPLSYQWFIGASGTTTTPIAGATASSYTTPALASTTSYWVRVSNSAGTVNSSTATITVTTPQSNLVFTFTPNPAQTVGLTTNCGNATPAKTWNYTLTIQNNSAVPFTISSFSTQVEGISGSPVYTNFSNTAADFASWFGTSTIAPNASVMGARSVCLSNPPPTGTVGYLLHTFTGTNGNGPFTTPTRLMLN